MSLSPRDCIKRALRLNGTLAGGSEPTSADLTDTFLAFNTMKRAMFGTLIGTRLSAQAASGTTQQAENGGEYAIPSVPFALAAPNAPRGGDRFGAVDANLSFGANNLTVNRGSALIEGQAVDLVIFANGDNRRWWFRPDAANWVREADWASPDTPIEFPDALIAYLPYMLAAVIAPEFGADLRADVIAGASEGREAFARAYARRGRNGLDRPIGLPQAQPQAAGA